MKKFSMIIMLFFTVDVLCMEDLAMNYIKMEAKYQEYANLEKDNCIKLEEFAKNNPDIIFEKFYDIFACSATHVSFYHVFALLSALGQVCSSNVVDSCAINRICKHVAYLRSSEEIKHKEIKELIDITDSIISYIPYAGMTLCVYSPTQTCIPLDTRRNTYNFILDWLQNEKNKNTSVKALFKFMNCITIKTS